MNIPDNKELSVNRLAACFNNTSATYKYYWLLSIIQSVEVGNKKILKRELFARMISNAWYTVNYFHISFGKQDLIQDAVRSINRFEGIPIDEHLNLVFRKLSSTSNPEIINQLYHFDKNVPHWFLSPWFPGMSKKEIYSASNQVNQDCLYALESTTIEIKSHWVKYLWENSRLLKDFCYWNLTLFLQAKNPNVPDIANKLIKPGRRNSLSRQRNLFWNLVLNELGSVNCIYTGKSLNIGNYAVEHFIPYNFVSHDLIWNLIPADPAFNSTKSDKLPKLDKYFNAFFQLQKSAIEIVNSSSPGNKLLEDYLTILPDISSSFTEEKFREVIQPLISIASNNGFEYLE